jgi:uncharacterized ion transporter superfamily protein YfcC
MLLATLFGVFEEGLILLPVVLVLATAMGWNKETGLMLCLLGLAAGFGIGLTNPFNIGTASAAAGTNVLSGIGFRIIAFAFLAVFTALYIRYFAKRAERAKAAEKEKATETEGGLTDGEERQELEEFSTQDLETLRIFKIFAIFFGAVLAVMILSLAIPALTSFATYLMAGAFLIGSILSGTLASKSFKNTVKNFLKGVLAVLPAIFILMMASSVKYIAVKGNILDTFIDYFARQLDGVSPYAAIIMIFGIVMVFNFFISSASAKAVLMIPFLCSLPIPSVSAELIVLAYILGDGFTNVFFPTNATLLVGLSIADVSYGKWFKKTWLFQLALASFSVVLLIIGVAISY